MFPSQSQDAWHGAVDVNACPALSGLALTWLFLVVPAFFPFRMGVFGLCLSTLGMLWYYRDLWRGCLESQKRFSLFKCWDCYPLWGLLKLDWIQYILQNLFYEMTMGVRGGMLCFEYETSPDVPRIWTPGPRPVALLWKVVEGSGATWGFRTQFPLWGWSVSCPATPYEEEMGPNWSPAAMEPPITTSPL